VLSITAIMELIRIGNDCPHTDGIGVYYARFLYNSLIANSGNYYSFADDCNPSGLYRVAPLANSDFNAELFPNPTKNNFSIQLSNRINEEVFLVVTDAVGKKVLNLSIETIEGRCFISNNLSSGIYLVSITNSKNEKVVKKLLVE
jgi:hypothetical protein